MSGAAPFLFENGLTTTWLRGSIALQHNDFIDCFDLLAVHGGAATMAQADTRKKAKGRPSSNQALSQEQLMRGYRVPASAPAAAPKAADPVPAPAPAPAVATPAAQPLHAAVAGDRIVASPLAKRMAQQAGVDLAGLKGSGPNGRIVKADVEAASKGGAPKAAAPAPQAAAASAPAPAPAPAAKAPASVITAPHTLIPNSSMRKVIARRLSEAKATVPHFYVSLDIEIDALLKLRADLNARSPKDGPGAFKLSVNDLVIKAAAATLRRVPKVNASYTEDNTILYEDVDISVAVSIL
eukprot:gene13704-13820_t